MSLDKGATGPFKRVRVKLSHEFLRARQANNRHRPVRFEEEKGVSDCTEGINAGSPHVFQRGMMSGDTNDLREVPPRDQQRESKTHAWPVFHSEVSQCPTFQLKVNLFLFLCVPRSREPV